MRAWLKQRLWVWGPLLLAISLLSCRKSPPPLLSPETIPDQLAAANSVTSRPIPRRSQPLVITNGPAADTVKPATNNPPVITCGAPQTLPCGPADGQSVTLTAHVEDADGHALSVVWIVDGKERETQQVAAGTGLVTADLAFSYTVTPGDHAIKVTATDGTLNAFCETTVSIQKDTEDPVIACPRDVTVPVDPGRCAAIVTFAPQATDNCPDVSVACDPPSGAAFPIGVTVVNCQATDVAGHIARCAFSVAVQAGNRCPQNDAFWRQNPGAWSVNAMTLGNQVYTRGQLMPLLRAPLVTDASMALARQLIVATLNVAAGSDPRPICPELAQANDVLGSFENRLPYRVNVSTVAGRSMMDLATRLSGFNSGLISLNCLP